MLALLRWHEALQMGAAREARAAAQARAEPTAAALQKLARQLPPALQSVAERIEREAEALRREPATPEEAEKAALRELSALAGMARALGQRQALQQALAKQELTREAAAKMQAGDLAAAAQALEEAARQAAADPKAAAELQAALERLAAQQQLSEALREATRSGPAAVLQKLAAQLRTGAPAGEPKAGQPSAQDLQRLQAALENLQAGQANEGAEPASAVAQGDPGPPVLQFPSDHGESPGAALGQLATGQPGSEHEEGTTGAPLGERQEAARAGAELALRGAPGEKGEVATEAVPGGRDRARAKQQYRELYEAMAPAAEDAVLQEEIPLGSRLFLKRYFEAIRPRD